MDQDRFWQLIEAARGNAAPPAQSGGLLSRFRQMIQPAHGPGDGDCEQLVARLEASLKALPEDEIVGFDRELDARMTESYTNPLWAAAYLINGGCSDDGFDYFRGWLIAQGRAVYEAALANPESLAELNAPELETGNVECEDLLYVARQAYEAKTDKQLPPGEPLDWKLTGAEWDEDTVYELFPRLTARFGS